MSTQRFPDLDPDDIRQTRDALHAYSRILGDWLKSSTPHRKHWWHASLRPSLTGLTTGVIVSNIDFEIELDFRESALCVRTSTGENIREKLHGQPAAELAAQVRDFLHSAGVVASPQDDAGDDATSADAAGFSAYSAEVANKLARALSSVSAAMSGFRAGIREETSPIQIWPHHFDLSMIWLPGRKIPGQDPADEEYSDKQMNFGFVFGDESFAEPYFYVTAYPLPDEMPQLELPDGATWRSGDFNGAVLLYKDLVATEDPVAYLQELWTTLLAAGLTYLASNE
jgi:hypothetical protein